MSLVTRQLAPVLDQLNRIPLPDSTQVFVIGSLNITGHTYGPSTVSAREAHFGDRNRADMRKLLSFPSECSQTMDSILLWVDALTFSTAGPNHAKNTKPGYPPHDFDTPPASEKAVDDIGPLTLHSSTNEEPPDEYRDRDHDWYTPGRLFRIFAPLDAEIHEKEFILLETKNKEGPGLLIRIYDEDEKEASRGYFLRSHVLVQNYQRPNQRTNTRRKVVYLDEYEEQVAVPETWIELEHTYNIPFVKYRCVDCGVLDRGSLQDLRRCYVDWLKYNWSID